MSSMQAPGDAEIMAALNVGVMSQTDLCERIRSVFPRTLEEYQKEVREINDRNGWFDSERSFGDDIALLHSEVSEMFEAYRDHGLTDTTGAECEPHLPRDVHTDAPDDHLCKPEGVGSEAADVLVRLLDTCERWGIDLRYELERKIAYNRRREYRHGGKRV